MPEIEKRFPGASDRIARTAGILRATEEYLQQETRIWLKGEDPGKQDALALSVLREADAVMQPGILQDFFRDKLEDLCDDCKDRFERSPLCSRIRHLFPGRARDVPDRFSKRARAAW